MVGKKLNNRFFKLHTNLSIYKILKFLKVEESFFYKYNDFSDDITNLEIKKFSSFVNLTKDSLFFLNKDTPSNLKKELEKLTDQEKKRKELIKSRNDFLKKPEIKEYRKTHRVKENSVWKQDTKIYKQKNKIISMFPTIQIL